MSISTTAPEVKEARARYEWTQENVADELFVTRQMIQMVEAGKRRLNEQDTARLARKLDDGQFKLAMARRITGGSVVAFFGSVVSPQPHKIIVNIIQRANSKEIL
jgi:transcriptional regulator with XRE-family HTH domain